MSYVKFENYPSSDDFQTWKEIFDQAKDDPDFKAIKNYAHDEKCDKCPSSQPVKTVRDPNCKCGDPLWICLKPGQHIHPCPVHPDYVIYGSDLTL